ncbi:hypothetical protein ABZP36_001546 [Zizania latifolia]
MAEAGRRAGGGGDAVELSLRLTTGDTSCAAVAEHQAPAAMGSMTIFYNGQVCTINVTELQARTIISMANQESFTKHHQRQVRDDHHYHQAATSSSGGGSGVSAQFCIAGSSQTTAPAPSPRHDLEASAAAPMINQAATGLSMKRSLQRFLEKRKTRAAAAAAPYAGDRPAQPTRRQ